MGDTATGSTTPSGLGEMLRKAREAHGLTPADLARQLNLDLRLIEALEAEDLAALPAPVYVRGYLRRLAATLRLDEGALLHAHQRLAGSLEPAPLRSSPPIDTMKSSHEGGRRLPWLVAGLAVGVVLLGFFGAANLPLSWLERTPGPEQPLPEAPAVPAASTTLPLAPTPEPPPPAMPTTSSHGAAAPVVGEIVPPPTPTAEPLPVPSLELRATKGESWVQVKDATGKVLFEDVLKAGTSRQVEGPRPFQVVIGRAEAIQLSLDGKTVDLAPHTRPNGKAFLAKLGG